MAALGWESRCKPVKGVFLFLLTAVFSRSCDQEAVLHDVCVQVATVEHLVLSLIAGTARKRSQQPVTVSSLNFYS